MASAEPERVHREDEEEAPAGEDEDTGAQVAPIVRLEEVAVTTGEEDEEALLDLKAKLYRYDNGQWKERGTGTVKLLKHKETHKVRLVMRQSKTLKICANHLILPPMNVKEHSGNEKSCVWQCKDFADGELKDEFFCMRFTSIENCRSFMETFTEVVESHTKKEENTDATAAAGLLERLTVEEEESEPEKAAASEADTEKKPEPEKADAEKKPEPEKKDAEKKTESGPSA